MSDRIERVRVDALRPYARNARTHSKRQIEQIAASIKRFGFVNPVLIDDKHTIIAGHGRVEAARLLGLTEVPVLRVSHLSDEQKRAYIIADNRLAELAGWDRETLALEVEGLVELGFDVEVMGYETAEIDLMIDAVQAADPEAAPDPDDEPIAGPPAAPVSRSGDVWLCGRHRLLCANALDASAYARLMGEARADAIFTDPPYNVPIEGFVGGKGKIKRREFAMASGEMSSAAFTAFLTTTLGHAAAVSRDGAIAFVCMDWRHVGELSQAGAEVFDEFKNICVWTKSNAGMGSLYRSQHELVFVYKLGGDTHRNNIELGKHGRNRTNVWPYRGVNAFGAARDAELAMHPTVKPAALVEDAIKDVTGRGDLVLDPFGGSGSTLIAAERCGRTARLLEIDPGYCDVIVKRWQNHTGRAAINETTGSRFDEQNLLAPAPQR
jgi:DNA modification methylase